LEYDFGRGPHRCSRCTASTCPLQIQLLARSGWTGWMLMENSDKVPDRVQAMIEQRELWTSLVHRARKPTG
jgi:hypothetical protein